MSVNGFLLAAISLPVLMFSSCVHSQERLESCGKIDIPGRVLAGAVMEDSLVVCLRPVRIGEPVLDVFNLSGERRNALLSYGKGPNALLSASMTYNDGMFLVHDFIKENLFFIPADSLCVPGYVPEPVPTGTQSQFVLPIEGGTVFLNQYSFELQEPRYIVTDASCSFLQEQQLFDTFNIINGFLAYNDAEDVCVFIDRYNPEVEVWKGGRLMKSYSFRGGQKVEYSDHKSGVYTSRVFKGIFPASFTAYCFDDDHIYTVYDPSGKVIGRNDEGSLTYCLDAAKLLVLSWNGKVEESYLFPEGCHPVSISKSGSGTDIYVLTASGEYSYIEKFKL